MCVWLKVPGKDTAGSNNTWNYDNVSKHIDDAIEKGTKLCLPITSVIETGNHIAHLKNVNKESKDSAADALMDMVLKSAKEESPWAIFSRQQDILESPNFDSCIQEWNEIVKEKNHSLGDAIIVKIAELYAQEYDIEIFTGDRLLKTYEEQIKNKKKGSPQIQKNLRRNRK